jgi:sulfur carrier protein
MKLNINGEERDFSGVPTPFTLAALVENLGMKSDRVAVELNRDIVPRDRWAETMLNEGDRLEIVHFVGGGSASLSCRNSFSHPSSPNSLLDPQAPMPKMFETFCPAIVSNISGGSCKIVLHRKR